MQIERAGRRVQIRRDQPLAAAHARCLDARSGDGERAAIPGLRLIGRTILHMNAAHARGQPRGREQHAVTHTDSTGNDSAGDHQADALQSKAPIDGQPEPAIRRALHAFARFLQQAGTQRRDAGAGMAGNLVDPPAIAQPGTDIARHSRDAHRLDQVRLGNHGVDVAHAGQGQHREMLQCLRHRPVVGGDDQQHGIDAEHAGQHVW